MGTRVYAQVAVQRITADPPNIYGDAILSAQQNSIDQTSAIVHSSLWAMELVMKKQFKDAESGKYPYGLPDGSIGYPGNTDGSTLSDVTSYISGVSLNLDSLKTYIKDFLIDAEDPSTPINVKAWLFTPASDVSIFDNTMIQGVQKALFSYYNTDIEVNRPWHESLEEALLDSSVNSAYNLQGNELDTLFVRVGEPIDTYYAFDTPTDHVLHLNGTSFDYVANPPDEQDPGYYNSGYSYNEDAVALGDFDTTENYALVRYSRSVNAFATHWAIVSQLDLQDFGMAECGNTDQYGFTIIARASRVEIEPFGLLANAYDLFEIASDFEEEAYDVEYGVHRVGSVDEYVAPERFFNFMALADFDTQHLGYNVGYYNKSSEYVNDTVNPIAHPLIGDTDIPITEYYEIFGTTDNITDYQVITYDFNGEQYTPTSSNITYSLTPVSGEVIAVIKFKDTSNPNRTYYYYEMSNPDDEDTTWKCDIPELQCGRFLSDLSPITIGFGDESSYTQELDCNLNHIRIGEYGTKELIDDQITKMWFCYWHFRHFGYASNPDITDYIPPFNYYIFDPNTDVDGLDFYGRLLMAPFMGTRDPLPYYNLIPSYSPTDYSIRYTVEKYEFNYDQGFYEKVYDVTIVPPTLGDSIIARVGDYFAVSEVTYRDGVSYYLSVNNPDDANPLIEIVNNCSPFIPCPSETINPYGIYYPIVPIREDFIWWDDYDQRGSDHIKGVKKFFDNYKIGKLNDIEENIKKSILNNLLEGTGEDNYDDIYMINGCDIYSNHTDDNQYLFAHFLGVLQNNDLSYAVRNEHIVTESQYKHIIMFASIVLVDYGEVEPSIPPDIPRVWEYSHTWEDHPNTGNTEWIDNGENDPVSVFKQGEVKEFSNNVYTIHEKVNGLSTRDLVITGLQAVHHVEVASVNNPDDLDALIVDVIPSGEEQVLLDTFDGMTEQEKRDYLEANSDATPANPFIIPLLEIVVNNTDPRLQFKPNVKKRNLLFRSFHLVIYASTSVYVPWYQEARQFLFEAISLALTVYSLGSMGANIALAGSSASTSALASGATAEAASKAAADAMIKLVFQYGLNQLEGEIAKRILIKLIGKENAAVLEVLGALANGVNGIVGSLSTGTNLVINLANLSSAVATALTLKKTLETDDLEEEVKKSIKLVDKGTTILNEDPDEFLFRTTELNTLTLIESTKDPSKKNLDVLNVKGSINPFNTDINNFTKE